VSLELPKTRPVSKLSASKMIGTYASSMILPPTRGTKDGLAFAVSRKIHKEGTLAYKQFLRTGKGTGVVTSVINQNLNNEIMADLQKLILDNLLLSIKNTWD